MEKGRTFVLTGKHEDIIGPSEKVILLSVSDEGAGSSRSISLHPRRRRPALESLHEVGGHSRQLAPRRVRGLGETQLRQQTLLDDTQTVFPSVLVGAARRAHNLSGRRLLRAGEVGRDDRQPRSGQQQARGPGPRPARRAQRTRGTAERGGGACGVSGTDVCGRGRRVRH